MRRAQVAQLAPALQLCLGPALRAATQLVDCYGLLAVHFLLRAPARERALRLDVVEQRIGA